MKELIGGSIIREIGGAIHETLNDVGNFDENLVRNLRSAASKVNYSTGGATKNAGTGLEIYFMVY